MDGVFESIFPLGQLELKMGIFPLSFVRDQRQMRPPERTVLGSAAQQGERETSKPPGILFGEQAHADHVL